MNEQAKQHDAEHEEEHVCNANFDLSEEYKEQVIPLLDQLYKKCEELGLPALFAVHFMHDDEKSGQGVALVTNGCRTPKEYVISHKILQGNVQGMFGVKVEITASDKKEE